MRKVYQHVINLLGLTTEGHQWVAYRCPGCKDIHSFPVQPSPKGWAWNGDLDKPVFGPSVLVRSGHYSERFKPGEDECWCTWAERNPNDKHPPPYRCYLCHSFVGQNGAQPGEVIILGDSTVPAGVFKLETYTNG